jgi:hypothetical protein
MGLIFDGPKGNWLSTIFIFRFHSNKVKNVLILTPKEGFPGLIKFRNGTRPKWKSDGACRGIIWVKLPPVQKWNAKNFDWNPYYNGSLLTSQKKGLKKNEL